jgi:uncharacterized membrane protein YecN with MAPEG domain
MTVPITALHAGVLALLVTALAINVTAHRAKLKVQLGDECRRVRAARRPAHGPL